jgi:TPR repeat protein
MLIPRVKTKKKTIDDEDELAARASIDLPTQLEFLTEYSQSRTYMSRTASLGPSSMRESTTTTLIDSWDSEGKGDSPTIVISHVSDFMDGLFGKANKPFGEEEFISFMQNKYNNGKPIDSATLLAAVGASNGIITGSMVNNLLVKLEHASDSVAQSFPGYRVVSSDTLLEAFVKALTLETPADYLRIALLHYNGCIVEQNYRRALSFIDHAVSLNSARGFAYLGVLKFQGHGVSQSDYAAFSNFKLSAKGEDSFGMLCLYKCYQHGFGCEKDTVRARKWAERAAKIDHIGKYEFSKYLLELGELKLSAEYLEKAAESGLVEAKYEMGCYYRDGIGVDKSNLKAKVWFNQGASAGHNPSKNNLALLHNSSFDFHAGFSILSELASENYAPAIYNLGYMYEKGMGVEMDLRRATDLYHLGASHGYPQAQHALAQCYRSGKGVQADMGKFENWLTSAAEKNLAAAQSDLGLHLEYNATCKEDLEEAMSWYKKAGDAGEVNAMYNLGVLYKTGHKFLERNEEQALYWLSKAAKIGDIESQKELDALR